MSELSRQFYFSHFIGYICRNAQTVTHINQSHKQSPISHTSNQSHMKSLTRKRVIRIQLQTQSPRISLTYGLKPGPRGRQWFSNETKARLPTSDVQLPLLFLATNPSETRQQTEQRTPLDRPPGAIVYTGIILCRTVTAVYSEFFLCLVS